MIKCLRCGACCYHSLNGKKIKCKFLIILKSGKTFCRIYHQRDRIGKIIYVDKSGKKFICKKRVNVKKNFPNCPYNRKI